MNLIPEYFPQLDEEKINQFNQLMVDMPICNEKINLISRKDIVHLEERHILHSLAIANYISFRNGTKIIDIGTGGGFPGIPLAIMFPKCHFTLVDSIFKKITVVKEIAASLHLSNVDVIHGRAEKVKSKYDFVISRAVAEFPKLLSWTKKLINETSCNSIDNGIIALKGGDLQKELKSVRGQIQVTLLSKWYSEDWFKEKSIVYWHA